MAAMPAEPAVRCKTVTPAAMPAAVSVKAGIPHETVAPADMVPVTLIPAMAPAVPAAPPTVVESIVGVELTGASGQRKNDLTTRCISPRTITPATPEVVEGNSRCARPGRVW
jgi:hypothetical protein